MARGLPEADIRREIAHQRGELRQIQGLRAVGDGPFGNGVYLNDEAVCADGDTGSGKGGNQAALARRMAGIENYRQMREFVERGNGRDVAGVARDGLEGANAALAENYVWIAVGHDVFGGHEELFYGAAEAAFEQHRASALPQRLQQHEVLHVA